MIDVDVRLDRGDFTLEAAFTAGAGVTALFGPSGSGKTSLIALVAGLERPDRGRIAVDGRVLADTARGLFVPRHRRRIGLVFQDARLFPHLSVAANLSYGRWFAPRGERRVDRAAVVDTLGIGHLLDRWPATLSGGERQRVAIGRALLSEPRALLMDEPLASLDTPRRVEILPLIEHVRDAFRIPILYVSHAVDEVARLAATVVVIEAGRVVATGPPGAVLRPVRALGGGRFDVVSVLEGVAGPADESYALTPVEHPAGTIWLTGRVGTPGQPVRVIVRGSDVALSVGRPSGLTIRTVLHGEVAGVTRSDGPLATVEVALPGGDRLSAVVTRRGLDELGLDAGDHVHALVKTVALDERPLASG